MLQFIVRPADRYTVAEQAQMAIEGGCGWVQLALDGVDNAEARDIALEVMPLCKDSETFLVIDSRVDLVNELKVSGVHLYPSDMPAAEARELLGPHAVIGVTIENAEQGIHLKDLDIDYLQLSPFAGAECLGVEGVAGVIAELRSRQVNFPIVVAGGVTLADVALLKQCGATSVAVGTDITSSPDPVARTAQYLAALS